MSDTKLFSAQEAWNLQRARSREALQPVVIEITEAVRSYIEEGGQDTEITHDLHGLSEAEIDRIDSILSGLGYCVDRRGNQHQHRVGLILP